MRGPTISVVLVFLGLSTLGARYWRAWEQPPSGRSSRRVCEPRSRHPIAQGVEEEAACRLETDTWVSAVDGLKGVRLRLRGGKAADGSSVTDNESVKKKKDRLREGDGSKRSSSTKTKEVSTANKPPTSSAQDASPSPLTPRSSAKRSTAAVLKPTVHKKVRMSIAKSKEAGSEEGRRETHSDDASSKYIQPREGRSIAKSKLEGSGGLRNRTTDMMTTGGKHNKIKRLRNSSGLVRSMRRRGGKRGKAQRQKLRAVKEELRQNRTQASNATTNAQVVRHFHILQKKLAVAQKQGNESLVEKLKTKIEQTGGLRGYQDVLQQSKVIFNSTLWVLQELRFRGVVNNTNGGKTHVKLLDVGCPTYSYHDQPMVDATCIDLNPRDKHVLEMDVLDFGHKWCAKKDQAYDAVVLSLVLNMEGSPNKRGQMLAAGAGMLRKGGLLFLSLPKSCVLNSRYCNPGHLKELTRTLSLKILKVKYTNKLALWVFLKRSNSSHHQIPVLSPPQQLHEPSH